MAAAVDLNSQLAEGFELPPFGVPLEDIARLTISATGERWHQRHSVVEREDVLPYVTSVSLCCGLHSGDPVLLKRAARAAVSRGIHVGAHPSYPGVFSYGQKRVDLSDDDLEAILLYQLGAAAAVVESVGSRVRHVKCHGPLSADVSYDERVCGVLIKAIAKFDPGLIVVCNAGSPGLEWVRSAGLRAAGEGYVDRGYDASGRPVPRGHAQALLTDAQAVRERTTQMVCDGRVTCVDGKTLAVNVDTLFLHSDTPGAAELGAGVVGALRAAGVALKPLDQIAN